MSQLEDLEFIDGGVQIMNKTMSVATGCLQEREDAPLLHNRPDPYYTNKSEKPHHRTMIEMAAKGYTVKEIAQMTGFTAVCVNNILRQKPLQQTLVNSIQRTMSEDEQVVLIIRENVVKAVTALAKIVDGGEGVRASDRIAAAEALLCRRYGKPNQPINREKGIDLDSLSIAELANDLPSTNQTATS